MKKWMAMAAALLAGTTVWAGDKLNMVVGTYTGSGSQGIYSFRFDQSNGTATLLDSVETDNPSYLTFSKNGRFVYAVNEQTDASKAALSAFRFDPKTGHLSLMNRQPTEGGDPCFVETNGQLALTANYSRGSMSVFPILRDGSLGERSCLFEGHAKAGAERPQHVPHVHTARFTADGHILATDFSVDQLLRFRVDGLRVTGLGVAGELVEGSAPRHLEFSRDQKRVYVMSELGGTVTVFANGRAQLTRLQTIASDSVGGRGGADIHLSADGRYLYASNRLKADGLSIFSVDAQTGLLRKVGYQLTGIHPRNFAITPNDRFLLCACRDSNVIEVYRRDTETGLLTLVNRIELPKPVCIKFGAIR